MMLKYLIEGCGIAFVTQFLLGKKTDIQGIALITVIITVTLMILDQFAPEIGQSTRQGAGFAIGAQQVGGGSGSDYTGLETGQDAADYQPDCKEGFTPKQLLEGMDDKVAIDYYSNDRSVGDKCPKAQERDGIVTQLPQVNVLERFMDDKTALEYYDNDRQPPSCDIHESFTNQIVQQKGGADVTAFDAAANADIYSNYIAGPGQTVGQRGLVYGNLKIAPNQEHLARIKQTVYSGDLINIFDTKGNKLVLLGTSKFVRAAPDGKIGLDDKFFKLRLESVSNHKTDRMMPLKYGDAFKIVFNDDAARPHYLNHRGDLNTLESGRDNLFELVNYDSPDSMDVVSFTDKLLLRKSSEGESLRYLKLDYDRARVETNSSMDRATVFLIQPQRGCGPLWRFDSDTRTTNTFSPSQVRDIVNARTQLITDQLNTCQSSLRSYKGLSAADDDQLKIGNDDASAATGETPMELEGTTTEDAVSMEILPEQQA